jgi:hypothetical protein
MAILSEAYNTNSNTNLMVNGGDRAIADSTDGRFSNLPSSFRGGGKSKRRHHRSKKNNRSKKHRKPQSKSRK